MAAHTWTQDSPGGPWQNFYISNELLKQAAGQTKILPFTQVPDQKFGAHLGETINLYRINRLSLPTVDTLSETMRIPIDKLTLSTRAITVTEHGRGVEYTNLNEQLSVFSPSNFLQKELIRQMHYAVDRSAGRAFQSTDSRICFIPTSATGGTFDTDGTPSTVASAEFTFAHTGVLADYLAGDIHCPPWSGDEYMGITTRRTLRGLKSDTLWQSIALYLKDGDLFYRGEAGMTENIRWVQVDVQDTLDNSVGTSTTIGEGMVFGDEAVARVEVEAPHLRANPNFNNDFNRTNAVAWYGIYAFSPFYDVSTDGFARIIRITSS